MAEDIINTNDTAPETNEPEQSEATEKEPSVDVNKLRAELARMKAAMDKAAKEAGDAKKALRAKQTAEEAAAEEQKEQREAMEKELAQLRKESNVAKVSKKVFTIVQDEAMANDIANYLYGAEDTDAALDAFAKAWKARENKLRIEYGKVPPPGVGSSTGVSITREQFDNMTMMEKSEFYREHTDEYNRLMGRA